MSKADSKSKDAEILNSPQYKAAAEFLKKVHCDINKDEDIYTLRYFDFIAGYNECTQQSAADKERMIELQKILGDIMHCNACPTCAQIAKTTLNK